MNYLMIIGMLAAGVWFVITISDLLATFRYTEKLRKIHHELELIDSYFCNLKERIDKNHINSSIDCHIERGKDLSNPADIENEPVAWFVCIIVTLVILAFFFGCGIYHNRCLESSTKNGVKQGYQQAIHEVQQKHPNWRHDE